MQLIQKIGLSLLTWLSMGTAYAVDMTDEMYIRQVQPIFESRCIACHSCFNAPCQMNLQSYEGFERGANKSLVYNGGRSQSVEPTRMWIDAHSTDVWRQKGFYSLNTSKSPSDNLFFELLQHRVKTSDVKIEKQVAESMYCPSSMEEYNKLGKTKDQVAMPYGFPPLNSEELKKVETWVTAGSPRSPAQEQLRVSKKHKNIQKFIRDWESFLNNKSLKHQLVSRYIYEHLFLGHLYFPQDQGTFFRLVRSKTQCDSGIDEIGTRRPNDSPGVDKFYYCLRQFEGAIAAKTHIPFELTSDRLNRYKKMFWEQAWKVDKMPSYEAGVAENPFVAFKDIPVKARYQFLLDESQFFVNNFIRGPVCNGSMAVNSIQEQFYIFFLNPESDNTVLSAGYESKSRELLMLPGVWGSDVEIKETPAFISKIVDHREAYRKFRSEWKHKLRPQGYSINDIWDGDEVNPNAVLTVFRHDDNAAVLKGAIGDLSKTVIILDYPLFERLVYNLYVNFDVFGNVGHQLLTRLYMDFIRMEGEELFLAFLPSKDRVNIREQWYKGFMTQMKMKYVFPPLGLTEPTAVPFLEGRDSKKQMIEKILFGYLKPEARGILDHINWKKINPGEAIKDNTQQDNVERSLWNIASVQAGEKTPFAQFFPDLSLLKVKMANGTFRVFSLIHNKEHENVSWILVESMRFAPQEDSLTIKEGYWGGYPNIIFDVSEKDLSQFVNQVQSLKTEKDYKKLKKQFAISRYNPEFWNHYDALIANFKKTAPVDFGYLDLTRYDMD